MRRALAVAVLGLLVSGTAMAEKAKKPGAKPKAPAAKENPTLGLPELTPPADNPQTPEKIELGHQLFWDARLSKSGKMSCHTCHLPDKGLADGQKLSTKDDGKVNTPTRRRSTTSAYQPYFYWDGRSPTLEKQIAAAWKGQMGLGDDATAAATAKTIGEIPGYKAQYTKVFAADATPDTVVKALAAYVRTLNSGNSAYDRAEAGDAKAYTPAQKRGFELYKGKAKCSLCHAGFALTAWEFKNIGIGMDKPTPIRAAARSTRRTRS